MLLQYISIVTQNMGVGTMGAVGVLMGTVGVPMCAVGVLMGAVVVSMEALGMLMGAVGVPKRRCRRAPRALWACPWALWA